MLQRKLGHSRCFLQLVSYIYPHRIIILVTEEVGIPAGILRTVIAVTTLVQSLSLASKYPDHKISLTKPRAVSVTLDAS